MPENSGTLENRKAAEELPASRSIPMPENSGTSENRKAAEELPAAESISMPEDIGTPEDMGIEKWGSLAVFLENRRKKARYNKCEMAPASAGSE